MKLDPRQIINEKQDPGVSRQVSTFKPKRPVGWFEIPQFHWVPDKVDTRDYKYIPTAPKLPNQVDLRPYCTAIEDQGNLGSCTGNAVAGAIELLNKRNNKPTDVSRLYIYYFERLLEGTVNYDNGAYIRDGIKATNKFGAPLEQYWPYNISKFKVAPSKVATDDGAKRKVTLYQRAADFNACIDALANGFPVIIGFTVYASFVSNAVARTGNMPYPNVAKEKVLGGHAVLLVGYDMSRQVFIVRNSWGQYWGDKGYFYMPFQVIQNTSMSSDFWVINQVQNP